ncbi:MAG TPA: amidohydrolase [Pirellulales bacterium]|jgi:aminobenzoyl-glutamate utilization protein B
MHSRFFIDCGALRLIGCLWGAAVLMAPATCHADKGALPAAIDARAEAAWQAALQIWEWAEPGYQEEKSSALLTQMLEREGFEIERGVAGIPTAFTATAGSGRPVIAILGEYDALPGLSQQAVPEQLPRIPGGYGQACGHHLFGTASATAAIVVAEQLKKDKLPGTVRFYGCPAEEGGAAKVFMVRAGLFNDCDVALHWHPGSRNAAGDATCLARMAAKFRFHGTSAHAAASPEQGRSALDAVELTNHASELLREHTPDLTRIHHVITAGGGAPNVVPDFAEVFYYVRHPQSDVAKAVYARLVKCAEAGALATETKLEVDYLGGTHELVPNDTLSRITLANLQALNDLKFTPEEEKFAARIATTLPKPAALDTLREVSDNKGGQNKGSTDVGDVSWVVPTTGFSTVCWVPGTPGHSWQATAAGGTTIGRKGMLLAAKVLAATAYDLATKPEAIAAAKDELARRVGKEGYQSLLTPGQKPPLDYRKAPVVGGVAE